MSTSSVIPVSLRNKINIGSNIRTIILYSFESRNCHGYKLKINITKVTGASLMKVSLV